jgi:DNA-binding transcriptional LysR family regulator
MNLQQLRYLVAIADEGSVSAAAKSLHVTQPVMSRSIRSFETEQCVTVFCLSGRRLTPTVAGREIIDAARRALAAVDSVVDAARAARSHAGLTIAATPTNGLLLGPTLSELVSRHPGVEVALRRAADKEDMYQRVERGTAEIGFGELDGTEPASLTVEPVADAEVVLVSPAGTALPAAVTWDDVVTQPLILPSGDSGRRKQVDKIARSETGGPPHAALVVDDRGSWMAAAQAGLGSFLSYRPVVASLANVEIRSFTPKTTATVAFMQRRDRTSLLAGQLIKIARDTLASSAAD